MVCAASIVVRNSEISGAWRMQSTARIGFVSRSREAFLPSHVTSTGFSASPRYFSGEAQNGNLKYLLIGNAVFAGIETLDLEAPALQRLELWRHSGFERTLRLFAIC